jgi:hypothetical protein
MTGIQHVYMELRDAVAHSGPRDHRVLRDLEGRRIGSCRTPPGAMT